MSSWSRLRTKQRFAIHDLGLNGSTFSLDYNHDLQFIALIDESKKVLFALGIGLYNLKCKFNITRIELGRVNGHLQVADQYNYRSSTSEEVRYIQIKIPSSLVLSTFDSDYHIITQVIRLLMNSSPGCLYTPRTVFFYFVIFVDHVLTK